MADFGSPVAQNVNPGGGLQTLSQLLDIQGKRIGLQRQQQALDTGQYQQQSAQAEATVAGQGAKENQALAQLLQDPVKNGIIDDQGNPTAQGESIIMKVAPTTGAENFGKVVNAARTKVEFTNSLNNLNTAERQEIGATISGAAANGNIGDIQTAARNLLETKKGTPAYEDYRKILEPTMQVVNHVAQKTNDPEAARQAALGVGRQVLGAQAVVGAGGIANPQDSSNAAGQLQNRNQITGARTAPQMGPGTTNPTTPQVAAASTRAVGTAGTDIDRSNQVSGTQKEAANVIDITKRIDQLANGIYSGKAAAAIKEAGNFLGFTDLGAAKAELDKDLGRIRGSAVANSGSDNRANELLAGYPTSATPEQVIHQAMDYARGGARQNLAEGRLLDRYRQKDAEGLKGFAAADDLLNRSTTPLMHEYQSLKTPEEQARFFTRNFQTRAQAKAFRDSVEALNTHSDVAK